MNYIFTWNGSNSAAAITHGPRVCGYQSCAPGIRHAPGWVAASRRLKTQVCDEGFFFFNLKTWLIAAKVCGCGTLKRLHVHKRLMICGVKGAAGVLVEECSQVSAITAQVLAVGKHRRKRARDLDAESLPCGCRFKSFPLSYSAATDNRK